MAKFRDSDISAPDFLVVPDLVAGGMDSLEFSLSWVKELQGVAPLYLAVQDGMGAYSVAPHIAQFDGVFIGGTLKWKMRTGEEWVAFAHHYGKPCHIGRVGTAKRALWAMEIAADSIDSCVPLWSFDNLRVFKAAIDCGQLVLWPKPKTPLLRELEAS